MKYFRTAIVLNTALLAVAALFCLNLAGQTQRSANDSKGKALTGPSGKFGPVIEILLPAAKTNRPIDILDLETGRALLQPPLEHFDSRADAIMGWIRSNGLDISGSVWASGAACVTYDMTVVAAEEKCWKETTEDELRNNPALAPGRHSPRRLLVLGHDRPDTYMFRTGDGTLGMLQIVGVGQDRKGVKIRYKLINPSKLLSAARELISPQN